MAFDVNSVIEWCKNNWVIIVLVLSVGVLVYMYIKKKPTFKPVDRTIILSAQFEKRNKLNTSPLKWCYRGNELYGKLLKLNPVQIDNKGELLDCIELIIQPQLLGIRGIPDFFSKNIRVVVNRENADYDYGKSQMDIEPSTVFDLRNGVFYDRAGKDLYIQYIKDRLQIADDFENLSSVYYVKAQEQATIQPQAAITIQSKQLDLEAEKEKRKHLVS